MIRVTVERLPLGSEEHKRHLGTAEIWNDASGDWFMGNYKFRLSRRGNPKSNWRTGSVSGFPRLRLGAWDLLYRALKEVLQERNL